MNDSKISKYSFLQQQSPLSPDMSNVAKVVRYVHPFKVNNFAFLKTISFVVNLHIYLPNDRFQAQHVIFSPTIKSNFAGYV